PRIADMIQAYVFAGAAGSGRRAVMADLISSGLSLGAIEGPVAVALPLGEPRDGTDALFEDRAALVRWNGLADGAAIPALPEGVGTLFILLDGRADPVDQFENLAKWFAANPHVSLARIVSVISSRLFFENAGLKIWMDACVRFSDAVLFSSREGVPNKWLSDVQARFRKECYPCVFAFVKEKGLDNPAEILCPEARRMSLAFDYLGEPVPEAGAEEPDYEIVDETDEGEEEIVEDDEEDELPPPEPWFERDAAGRRKIRLPDIVEYLK
ncbi:MAG TPA: hypothetical protein PKI32_06935, partial [Opitutales bacterium]|nr:hypothetical protein [Opitutales bacterium]